MTSLKFAYDRKHREWVAPIDDSKAILISVNREDEPKMYSIWFIDSSSGSLISQTPDYREAATIASEYVNKQVITQKV